MNTVVELPEFIKRASKLLHEEERRQLVVYFFYNKEMPLFLLTVFGKSEKANLSISERNNLRKLTQILIKSYGGKK